MANIVPNNRGRALTSAEVNQYVTQIGEITDNDLWNLASSVYNMDYDTFLVWCGWEAGERYENSGSFNNDAWYLGYMCSCTAVNLYMCYSDKTADGLSAVIRGGGGSWYSTANMQTRGRNLLSDYSNSDNQRTMKVCFLSLSNPDQRTWEFAGDYYGSEYTILHCYAKDQYGNLVDVWSSMNPSGTRTYSYDVDSGGVLGQGYDVYSDTGVPTKLSEFRAKIFHALACPTGYWSGMGIENFGYWNGSLFYFDCVNLIKAILGGWFDRRVVGLCSPNLISQILSQTGDCNEWGLITQCAGMSSDFTQLTQTSVLYMDGHIGCFVGDYVRDGKTYNVIECTSGYMGTGVVSSYVTSTGMRTTDASSGVSHGYWTYHGLLTPWLIYDVGNIDPGGNISPVNPGGGGVEPDPEYTNPYFPTFSNKQWMYQKRQDLLPKNRWKYV